MNDREVGPSLVQFPSTIFGSIRRALLADHQPAEAARLLRDFGLEAGSAFYDRFVAFLADRAPDSAARPDELDPEAFWAALSEFFQSLGWGELRQQALNPAVFSLSSDNWRESQADEGRLAGCQFTTGMLAEFLQRAAGQDVAVLEVECRGKGGDRCSFLVGNEEALGVVFERLREGGAYADAIAALA